MKNNIILNTLKHVCKQSSFTYENKQVQTEDMTTVSNGTLSQRNFDIATFWTATLFELDDNVTQYNVNQDSSRLTKSYISKLGYLHLLFYKRIGFLTYTYLKQPNEAADCMPFLKIGENSFKSMCPFKNHAMPTSCANARVRVHVMQACL